MNDIPFWKAKSLTAMTKAEWESLCDGCGKCCLSKLEDDDTGEIYFTTVGCRLFDEGACRCTNYVDRFEHVSDCVQLTPENVTTIKWLPSTCAYRLVGEGRDLFDWHHLICGDKQEVHRQGVSVRGKVTALETDLATPEDFLDHMVDQEP